MKLNDATIKGCSNVRFSPKIFQQRHCDLKVVAVSYDLTKYIQKAPDDEAPAYPNAGSSELFTELYLTHLWVSAKSLIKNNNKLSGLVEPHDAQAMIMSIAGASRTRPFGNILSGREPVDTPSS